jgi:hypothetical protein
VSENAVPRRLFGSKWDDITGGWGNMYNEEFHNLYYSPNIIRTIKSNMRWRGHAARMGRWSHACRIFCGKARKKGATREIYT